MIWLLRDLDFVSVLLRATTLAFEALLLGGVAFLWLVARPAKASAIAESSCLRGIRWAAAAMILSEILSLSVAGALLVGDSGLQLRDLLNSGPFLAGISVALIAVLLWICARVDREGAPKSGKAVVAMLPLSLLLLAAMVSTSHATSRMDHRGLLALFTAVHHLGTAVWLGAMPFLLISLRRAESSKEALRSAQRYSLMAIVGAAALVSAGFGMAWFYVAAWKGLYQTAYGVVLDAKIYLFLLMIVLGAGNWFLLQRLRTEPKPLLARLRRFAEAEIGLGFTAVLAAASLGGQPPSVDVVSGRPSLPQIYARIHPELPRLTSPSATQLAPPTSLNVAIQQSAFGSVGPSDAMDRAWSEYNHHWAGLIVLLAGLLALLSRLPGMHWARFWPLSFAGLAVFILLRADPENWPVGPRPFWGSFSAPDVLQHRAAALLILVFAVFECAVQASWLQKQWATLVFPGMCALGAALLLTHTQTAGDVKDELYGLLTHIPIAMLGATAGWSRWLELRLPKGGRHARIAAFLWPVCLVLAGMLLLNYRET